MITVAVNNKCSSDGLILFFFFPNMAPRLVLVIANTIIFVSVFASYFLAYCKVLRSSNKNTTSKRLVKTVTIILISAAFCYGPCLVITAVKGRTIEIQNLSSNIDFYLYISLTFLFLNCAVNSVVFLARNTANRRFITNSIRSGYRNDVTVIGNFKSSIY